MKYFTYGSNMLTERLRARVSSARNPIPFTLKKFWLRFHKKSDDGSGKCNIVASACGDDVVHGVLFEVENHQIKALDRAEGVGHGYRRDEIAVSINGTKTEAFVYVAEKNAIDDALVPYKWYYDLVLSGAKQHDLPSDYVAGLRAIPFTHDPTQDRKSRRDALAALKKYTESKKMA